MWYYFQILDKDDEITGSARVWGASKDDAQRQADEMAAQNGGKAGKVEEF